MSERVRGAKIRPDNLKAIIDAIEDNAPRDRDGELMTPYRGWVAAIRKDIGMYERWRRGVGGGD